MTLTVDSTDVYTVTVDGVRVSVVNVDGNRVFPDFYSEITAGSGSVGELTAHGYSDGFSGFGTFGSLARDTTIDGNAIHFIYWVDGKLRLRVDGTHTQTGLFSRFRLETEDGFNEYTASGANEFDQNSGDTVWRWNDATQLLASGNVYRWWMFF